MTIQETRRALVIEDDAIIAGRLAELLSNLGYDCIIEETAAGAVSAAVGRRPDLMIVDVHLREGSGVDVVEQLARSGPIPHVYITGHTTDFDLRNRGTIVLRKPFSEPAFLLAIECVLADEKRPPLKDMSIRGVPAAVPRPAVSR